MLVHLVVMVMVVVVYAHHLDRARFPERSLVVSGVAQHAVVRGEAPLAHALALIIVAMLVHMAVRVMVVVVYARHGTRRLSLCAHEARTPRRRAGRKCGTTATPRTLEGRILRGCLENK